LPCQNMLLGEMYMQTQRHVMTYYKRKLYKGRSVVARAADFLFLRIFFFAAVYLVCIYLLRIIWLCLLLAALLTVAYKPWPAYL